MYTNTNSTSQSAFARNVEALLVFFRLFYPYQSEAFVHIYPRIFSCFQSISVQKVSNFRREILNTLFIFCNNCRACVELTLEIQRESIRFLRTGMLGERDCNKVENKTFLLVFSTSLKFHTTIN
jgi:hypothetical protein